MGGRGASSSLTNPVLGKKGKAKTQEQALAATNPNYKSRTAEYTRNCQRCVYAYELQRRGYNVEAKARVLSGTDPMFGGNWKHGFKNQTWTRQGELGTRNATVEKNIADKMKNWGDGSRAIVYVAWKGGSAHVFNVENTGGKVSIFDGQTGKKHSLSEYLSIAKPSKTMISRVDNLDVNEGVMKHAVQPKGRK